jgi:hypothetical protein
VAEWNQRAKEIIAPGFTSPAMPPLERPGLEGWITRDGYKNLDDPPLACATSRAGILSSAGARHPVRDEGESGQQQPLLSDTELCQLRSRWSDIQADFVDEPRRSVDQAGQLVVAAMHRLAESFATERTALETQFDRGGDVSTEELRVALQRYRAIFTRLLDAA